MADERAQRSTLRLTIEDEPSGDLLVMIAGYRSRVRDVRVAGRISELVRSDDPVKLLEAAALGATPLVEAAHLRTRNAETRELRALADLDDATAEVTRLRAALGEALDGWADRDGDGLDVDDRRRIRATVGMSDDALTTAAR